MLEAAELEPLKARAQAARVSELMGEDAEAAKKGGDEGRKGEISRYGREENKYMLLLLN